MTVTLDQFTELPPDLEAHEPPEARGLTRDGVRMLVTDKASGGVAHHRFTDLPDLLKPGDLLVVNTSGTLPAAVHTERIAVHFSGRLDGGDWLVELRELTRRATVPYAGGLAGEWIPLPGGATLRLIDRHTPRLWRARLDRDVVAYLRGHGRPIRYSYVDREWPLSAYQTVFGVDPGSAEMPSAGRPFSDALVTRLVAKGVAFAPVTLHTGVASTEKDEPPYAEWFNVPASTARRVEDTRRSGGRVIAVGTTGVRALESAADPDGRARAASGFTEHIVTPEGGVRLVDGLLTGLHEPKSTHLWMLRAIAGEDLLARSYAAAVEGRYLWHEFGDVHLIA
ncbi:S-adenosylmethionine:tRNA ribosyltransferase-isomerase [Phytomonospora endophytica]|uniref:S-adenosylmethionine:tRNA ribosyltransferase-isomerase n=1 Tax=Phytomonospora endophytica TaxID=714109 RepID=A0A841FK67_9ACTN|nr:S-adenosylmethionine:tRNA ribosyltransferase-isomerase [Phytomonospora endophytica]MBB6033537.1 S-adenosylmethionine:tRNA ribosyltransferase-isomerase [Phytomonospora endophytica]GIG64945.1 queuosine biosynthesis protein [Phytomonospora endophytica]